MNHRPATPVGDLPDLLPTPDRAARAEQAAHAAAVVTGLIALALAVAAAVIR